MHDIITKLLPALTVPALLLVGTAAHAASLQTTSGSLSEQVSTENGFDFVLAINGIATNDNASAATSVVLDCSVDEVAKSVDCVGTMTLGSQSADIFMGYDNGLEKAAWGVELNISNGFKTVHSLWGEEVMSNAMAAPYPWTSVQWFDGTNNRVFWYTSTWAATFESITGMPYSTVTDIWTW